MVAVGVYPLKAPFILRLPCVSGIVCRTLLTVLHMRNLCEFLRQNPSIVTANWQLLPVDASLAVQPLCESAIETSRPTLDMALTALMTTVNTQERDTSSSQDNDSIHVSSITEYGTSTYSIKEGRTKSEGSLGGWGFMQRPMHIRRSDYEMHVTSDAMAPQ